MTEQPNVTRDNIKWLDEFFSQSAEDICQAFFEDPSLMDVVKERVLQVQAVALGIHLEEIPGD